MISLAVDLARFLTVVTPAFYTRTDSLIDELVQNAQRAGATTLTSSFSKEQIVFSDNGRGCSDFSNLLTIGKTGWDATTQGNESPFGLGFWSVLPLSRVVEVHSLGRGVRIDVDLLRSSGSTEGVVTEIESDSPSECGFRVVLHLVEGLADTAYEPTRFRQHLTRLVRFLPFEVVTVDGSACPTHEDFATSAKHDHALVIDGSGLYGILLPAPEEYAYIGYEYLTGHGVQVYYCGRYVASLGIKYLTGRINLDHGVANLRAPDRKAFIEDTKLKELRAALSSHASTIYSTILVSGSEEDRVRFADGIAAHVDIELLIASVQLRTLGGDAVGDLLRQAAKEQQDRVERARHDHTAERAASGEVVASEALPQVVVLQGALHLSGTSGLRNEGPSLTHQLIAGRPAAYALRRELSSCANYVSSCHIAGVQVIVVSTAYEERLVKHLHVPHVREVSRRLVFHVTVEPGPSKYPILAPSRLLVRMATAAEVLIEIGVMSSSMTLDGLPCAGSVPPSSFLAHDGKVLIDQAVVDVPLEEREYAAFVARHLVAFSVAVVASKGYGDAGTANNREAAMLLIAGLLQQISALSAPL